MAAVSPELAEAVAIALALDPRERYATAREMGRGAERRRARDPAVGAALRAEPHRARHRRHHGPGARAQARRLRQTASGVTPRRPRQAPAKASAAAPARQSPGRPPGAPLEPALLLLLGLLAVVLAVIAAVLISAPSSTRVVLRNVVYSDVQQAASALQQLVSENTK